MRRLLPVWTAAVVVVVTGLVHGFWTDRWSVSETLVRAETGIGQTPMTAGEWESKDNTPVKKQGDGTFYLVRRYHNRRTGEALSIALIGGRPGPVSIHTPDVCYGASGYDVTSPTTHTLETGGAQVPFFYTDALKQQSTRTTKLRIFWSWLVGDSWKVSDNPRLKFAAQPVLFKFYVVRELSTPVSPEQDPCMDFVRQVLPGLQQVLIHGS